jgi:hypothetical protein
MLSISSSVGMELSMLVSTAVVDVAAVVVDDVESAVEDVVDVVSVS